jgi:hypothetical protein
MPSVRHLTALISAGLLLACGGCRSEGEATNQSNQASENVASISLPPFPAPQPPLSREQLLVAVVHAASDFAAGVDDEARQKSLAESKFEFRIRFGCSGEGDSPQSAAGWTFDEDNGALRVRATPDLSKADPAVAEIAGKEIEAVEGFWIRRPWLLNAICPPLRASEDAATARPGDGKTGPARKASSQPGEADGVDDESAPSAGGVRKNVGIAQFFTASDARTMRRSGRSYQATKRLDDGDRVKGGFDLVLAGRLKPLADGRVIACSQAAPGKQPDCIVSVEFGKVWIERADTHEILAEWGSG